MASRVSKRTRETKGARPKSTGEPSSGKFYGNSFSKAVAEGRWKRWLDRYGIKEDSDEATALEVTFANAMYEVQEGANWSLTGIPGLKLFGGTHQQRITDALLTIKELEETKPGATDWFETYFYENSDEHAAWPKKESLFTVMDSEAVDYIPTDWTDALGWQGSGKNWTSEWQRAHTRGTVDSDEEHKEREVKEEIKEIQDLEKEERASIRKTEQLEKEVEALELEREQEKERFLPGKRDRSTPDIREQRERRRIYDDRRFDEFDEGIFSPEPPAPTFGDPGTTPPVPDEPASPIAFDDPHLDRPEDIPAVMSDDDEHAEPASTDLTSAPTTTPTPKKKIKDMTPEEREEYLEELKIRERVAKAKKEELENRKVEVKLGEDKRRADEDALLAQAKRFALEREEAAKRRGEEIQFQKEEEEDAIVKAGDKSERVRDEDGRIVYSPENRAHNDRRRRIIAKRRAVRNQIRRDATFSDPTKRDRTGESLTYAEEVQKQIADENTRVEQAQAAREENEPLENYVPHGDSFATGADAYDEAYKLGISDSDVRRDSTGRYTLYIRPFEKEILTKKSWEEDKLKQLEAKGTYSARTFRAPASGVAPQDSQTLDHEHKSIMSAARQEAVKSGRPFIEVYQEHLDADLARDEKGPRKDRKILTDENGNSISVPDVRKYDYSFDDLSQEDRDLLMNYDPKGYEHVRLNTEVKEVEGVMRPYEPTATERSLETGVLGQLEEEMAADRETARQADLEARLERTLDPSSSVGTPQPTASFETPGARGPVGPTGAPEAPIEQADFQDDALKPGIKSPYWKSPYDEIPEGMIDTGAGSYYDPNAEIPEGMVDMPLVNAYFDPNTNKIYDSSSGEFIREASYQELVEQPGLFSSPPGDSRRIGSPPVVNAAGQPTYREGMFEPHKPTLSQPFSPIPAPTMFPQEPEQPSLGVLGSSDQEFLGPLDTSRYIPDQSDLESNRLQSDFKNLYGTDDEVATQRRANELIRANPSPEALDRYQQEYNLRNPSRRRDPQNEAWERIKEGYEGEDPNFSMRPDELDYINRTRAGSGRPPMSPPQRWGPKKKSEYTSFRRPVGNTFG
jgi:hypothetical protein